MDPFWAWRWVRARRLLVAYLHDHVSADLVTQNPGEAIALVG